MKRALLLICLSAALQAADPSWLDRVAPVITSAEKKQYRSLNGEERAKFEENFWSTKAISGEEYFQRLAYVDSTFGSGKTGSGANTDQGRVYLSLGPPTSIKQLPSSRIFVPIEIWYYDHVPGLLNTELRLIFYQKNSVGFLKLYSPTLDTIRALLLPEAATVHAFGPNDSLSENDIRQILDVPPAEDEVISAAVNVAAGIKYSGNDEILGQITSPQTMLGKPLKADVTSRLITSHAPQLDVFQSNSEYGGVQLDLHLETEVTHELDLEILAGALPVYRNQLHLNFSKAERIAYTHRVDLLPGSYSLVFTMDGKSSTYPLDVRQIDGMGEIVRVDEGDASDRRLTPFEFDGKELELNANGKFAMIALSQPNKVTWRIRRGTETIWRSVSEPSRIATAALPGDLPPGTYMIDADIANDSRSTELVIRREPEDGAPAPIVSYNANLAPAMRQAFVGHQWLLRGKVAEARRSLQASLASGATDGAQIELARIDALTGNLDAGRDQVRKVLAHNPKSFEALSVLAYIETELQDYAVAAELYRKALAIQESPSLRAALAEVSRRERAN